MYAKRKAAQIDQLRKSCKSFQTSRFIQYNLDDKIDLRRNGCSGYCNLSQHKFDLKEGSYNYLRKMPMDTVTEEKANALLKERDDKSEELEKLERTTEKQIWISELKKLQTEYESHVKVRNGQTSTGDDTKATKPKPKARKNLKVVRK